jgi:hypothetical protein
MNIISDIISVQSQGIKYPGQVYLHEVRVESYSGFVIDIGPQVSDISITEDLFDNFVQATVTITDTLNLAKNVPFIGNETIIISFNTPSRKKVVYRFKVYKISPRVSPNGPGTSLYTLYLISAEYLTSLSVQFSRSFSGIKHSEMAESIYRSYLIDSTNPKKFFAGSTLGIHNFAFPYMHPSQALNLLAKKSVYGRDPSLCNMIFYENQKGFFFLPVNYWAIEKFKNYVAATYRYFPPNVSFAGKTIDEDLSRMEGYDVGTSANTARNIAEGIYSSTTVQYDITTKKLSKKLHSYNYDFYKSPHSSKHGVIPDVNENFSENYNSIRFYPPIASSKYGYPNAIDDTTIYNTYDRVSQIIGANQFSISFVAPGDSKRKIGEPIQIHIQSKEPKSTEDDPHLSGRYIISKLVHNIQGDTYKILVTAIKDSMDTPFPNKKNK